jgi:hypothetical protein
MTYATAIGPPSDHPRRHHGDAHARDAAEQAEVFTKIFQPATADEVRTAA